MADASTALPPVVDSFELDDGRHEKHFARAEENDISLLPASARARDRRTALGVTLSAFLYYASIYFIKYAMFAAEWKGESFRGMSFKSALAVAQPLGYLVGKGPALLLSPKLSRARLGSALLAVLWGAGLASIALGVGPAAAGVVGTGVMTAFLAPSWTLVMRAVEGRVLAEPIMAAVSTSWVGFAGVVRAIGTSMLAHGLAEREMVLVCTALGLAGGTCGALALGAQPPPSALDQLSRGARTHVASVRAAGAALFRRHSAGLCFLAAAYTLCGTLRGVRDAYLPELMKAVGVCDATASYAASELGSAALVLTLIASIGRVRLHTTAVRAILGLAAAGGALVGVSTVGFSRGWLRGYAWLSLVGAGGFMSYMPIGCVFFDRLIAAASERGTATLPSLLNDVLQMVANVLALHALERARARAVDAPPGGGRGGAWISASGPRPCAHADVLLLDFFGRSALFAGAAVALLSALALLAFEHSIKRARESAAAHAPTTPTRGASADVGVLPLEPAPGAALTG